MTNSLSDTRSPGSSSSSSSSVASTESLQPIPFTPRHNTPINTAASAAGATATTTGSSTTSVPTYSNLNIASSSPSRHGSSSNLRRAAASGPPLAAYPYTQATSSPIPMMTTSSSSAASSPRHSNVGTSTSTPGMGPTSSSTPTNNTHAHTPASAAAISSTKNVVRDSSPASSSSSTATSSTPRKTINDYEIVRTLGEGSYSTVFEVRDRHAPHRSYALKVLDKRHIVKAGKQKYVTVEKDTLTCLDRHPGIVRLYSTFHDPVSLYFVLELAQNGELLDYLKLFGSFTPSVAKFYAAQLLSAIQHMHSRHVLHRDLKPENILLDDNMRIKVTDFGTAKLLKTNSSNNNNSNGQAANDNNDNTKDQHEEKDQEQTRANSFVGTAEYVSPELLKNKTAYKASDFWAFGCILFQLIAGRPPFKGGSEYLTFQKIQNLDYQFIDSFPQDAKDLIQKLLVLDPFERLGSSVNGANDIKEHEFFNSIDWDNLWTCTPPAMETGLVPPKQTISRQALLEDTAAAWDDGIPPSTSWNDDGSGNGGQMMDVVEEPIPTIANQGSESNKDQSPNQDTVMKGDGQEQEESTKDITTATAPPPALPLPLPTAITNINTSADAASITPPPQNSTPIDNTWINILQPSELILYTSPIIDKSSVLFGTHRRLALTAFGRLLVFDETKSKLKLKNEIRLEQKSQQQQKQEQEKDQPAQTQAQSLDVNEFHEKKSGRGLRQRLSAFLPSSTSALKSIRSERSISSATFSTNTNNNNFEPCQFQLEYDQGSSTFSINLIQRQTTLKFTDPSGPNGASRWISELKALQE